MDNRVFDIVSEGKDALKLALGLAWDNAPGGKATHYKNLKLKSVTVYHKDEKGEVVWRQDQLVPDNQGTPTLILLWHEELDAQELPLEYDLEEAIQFVQKWLKKVEYGPEPDHDGHNGKGWRVFSEAWGHVMGHHYAIAAIQPEWAMYGK